MLTTARPRDHTTFGLSLLRSGIRLLGSQGLFSSCWSPSPGECRSSHEEIVYVDANKISEVNRKQSTTKMEQSASLVRKLETKDMDLEAKKYRVKALESKIGELQTIVLRLNALRAKTAELEARKNRIQATIEASDAELDEKKGCIKAVIKTKIVELEAEGHRASGLEATTRELERRNQRVHAL